MRLPITLWRSTLGELWRQIVMSATALVAVITFAITVKFFADGKLGALDMLRFMVLAVIPMLQYALPFAAGFAATLTYHRMTTDNEVNAAYASGISRTGVLMPAALSGLVVAGVMVLLVQLIIPEFLYRMEGLVTTRAAAVMQASVERGEPIRDDQRIVYADDVRSLEPTGGADAELLLFGVVIIETDKAGTPDSVTSASMARVRVYTGDAGPAAASGLAALTGAVPIAGTNDQEGGSWITVTLQDPVRTEPGRVFRGSEIAGWAWRVPGKFEDDPEFLPLMDLLSLPQNPDRMNFIRQRKRDLAYHLAERDTTDHLDKSLSQTGKATLLASDGRRRVVIHGSGIHYDELRGRWIISPPPGQPHVEVERIAPDEPASYVHLSAPDAWLHTDIGPSLQLRRLALVLGLEATDQGGVISRTASGQTASTLSMAEFSELLSEHDFASDYIALTSHQILELAAPRATPDNLFVSRPYSELKNRLAKLRREVMGQLHERWAYCAACLLMVLCGAVTAMRLGKSVPLTVYLWSFFPALLTVITMSAGQEVTKDLGAVGLFMLWGGVGILALYTVAAARFSGGR